MPKREQKITFAIKFGFETLRLAFIGNDGRIVDRSRGDLRRTAN